MIVQTIIGPITTLFILPRYLALSALACTVVIVVPTLVVIPVTTEAIGVGPGHVSSCLWSRSRRQDPAMLGVAFVAKLRCTCSNKGRS